MRIIDADGHVLERDIPWADLLEAPYRDRAPRVVKDNRGFPFVMMEGKLTPKPVGKACSFVGAPRSHHPQATTGMTDPVQRLKDMDLEGIKHLAALHIFARRFGQPRYRRLQDFVVFVQAFHPVGNPAAAGFHEGEFQFWKSFEHAAADDAERRDHLFKRMG